VSESNGGPGRRDPNRRSVFDPDAEGSASVFDRSGRPQNQHGGPPPTTAYGQPPVPGATASYGTGSAGPGSSVYDQRQPAPGSSVYDQRPSGYGRSGRSGGPRSGGNQDYGQGGYGSNQGYGQAGHSGGQGYDQSGSRGQGYGQSGDDSGQGYRRAGYRGQGYDPSGYGGGQQAYGSGDTRARPAAAPPRTRPDYGRPSGYGEQAYAGDRRPPARRRPDPGGYEREPRGGGGGGGLPFGLGALFGLAGFAAFVVGLLVLPWFEVGGEAVTLSDMRSAFTLAETDPETLLPDSGDTQPLDPSTLDPTAGIPTQDEITDAIESQAREAAAEAAADAIDSGRSRYLEMYTDWIWIALVGAVGLATVLGSLLGLRGLASTLVVLAGVAHGAALWVVFSGSGAPSPGIGVWVGVGGLLGVLAGIIAGPKRS
jgi:hypothetical protein